jgi:hypothetical protein
MVLTQLIVVSSDLETRLTLPVGTLSFQTTVAGPLGLETMRHIVD